MNYCCNISIMMSRLTRGKTKSLFVSYLKREAKDYRFQNIRTNIILYRLHSLKVQVHQPTLGDIKKKKTKIYFPIL